MKTSTMSSTSIRFLCAVILLAGSALPLLAQENDNGLYDNTKGLELYPPGYSPRVPPTSIQTVTTPDGYDNFDVGIDFAEQHIASNPNNLQQLVFGVNSSSPGSSWRHSEDAGLSWTLSNPPGTNSGDPFTAYDSLGNVYIQFLSGTSNPVLRSTNNGVTWGAAIPSATGGDRNTMAVDQTAGPYGGYLYTGAWSPNCTFARSTNFGATFTITLTTANTTPGNIIAIGANVLGGQNVQGGCVYFTSITGVNPQGTTFNFFRSTNGGATFDSMSTMTVAGYVGTLNTSTRLVINNARTRPYPMVAADNSNGPYRGRLYLVYASNEPAGNGNKPDIFIQYSTNQGATWTPRSQIVNDNANPTTTNEWFPAIWCDKNTGRLYVKWYDMRDDPTNQRAWVYATYSDNGGQTFAPNQKLSNTDMPYPGIACAPNTNCYRGDYDAIIPVGDVAMAVWTDFRNTTYQNMLAYFPDFAMLLSQSSISMRLTDSADVRVKVPSVKLYNGRVRFSATVSPPAPFTFSFVGGRDSLSAYPDSVTLRIRTAGVLAGVYTVTVTGKGPKGTPIHRRTISVDANTNLNTITVTAPNGGETWISGNVQNITWVPTGTVNNVKLEYSTNNGTVWSTIVASVPATPPTYAWTVPSTPTLQGRVRVSWTDSASVSDVSNGPFTISIGSITVTAPNGGENWTTGSLRNITWGRTGVVNSVKLEYSTNNGTAWSTIVASVPAVPSTYTWTVPTTPTTQGRVRATWTVSDTLTDMSDSAFTITIATFPIITTSPDSLVATLNAGGGTTSGTLTIGNTGTANLTWAITELGASLMRPYVRQPQADELYPNWQTGKGEADRYHGPAPAQPDTIVGPDSAGYRAIDSDSPGGPTYNWVDISGTGTPITGWAPSSDDGFVTIPMPFPFTFYGNTYDSVRVVTNGYVMFGVSSNQWTNSAIPNTALPNNACYGLWDDLNMSTSGTVHSYYDAPNSRFIIQYTNVPFYSGTGTATFQVILKSSGEIIYQYNSITGVTNSCTVGIENLGGTVALQVIYNANYLHNTMAIRISRDLSWVETAPSSGTITPGTNTPVTVTFNSVGLTAGTYRGVLAVTSNDLPRNPRNVPIRLSVVLTEVKDRPRSGIPQEFALEQNYPNPFNPTTTISYALPTQATVRLKIFDLLGQEVTTLVDGPQPGGYYSVMWTGNSDRGFLAASGVYTYRIEATTADGKVLNSLKKMLLLK